MSSMFLIQNQNNPTTNIIYQPSNTITVCQILTNQSQTQPTNTASVNLSTQRTFQPSKHSNIYNNNAITIHPQSQCQLQSSLIHNCCTTTPVSISTIHNNPTYQNTFYNHRNTPRLHTVNTPSRLPLATDFKHNTIGNPNFNCQMHQHVMPKLSTMPYLYVSIYQYL